MKILFVLPGLHLDASPRYRVYKYLPYLSDMGVKCKLSLPYPESCHGFLRYPRNKRQVIARIIFEGISRLKALLFLSPPADVVFIHKDSFPYGPPIFERCLNFLGKKFIYDFDDALYERHPSFAKEVKKGILDRMRHKNHTAEVIRLSSHVIVSNNYLKKYAVQFNENVSVIPTSIDIERYKLKNEYSPDNIVIGWIGNGGNLIYLDELQEVFVEIGSRYKNVSVKIVSDEEYKFDGVNSVFKQWQLENEIEDLRSFDIGIMPLIDTNYTKGKAGFKIIQYFGVGIPAVCSPVGTNLEIVREEENGFFANSKQEWVQKLSRLIENGELRRRLGARGRALVDQCYSIEKNVHKLCSVLESVAFAKE